MNTPETAGSKPSAEFSLFPSGPIYRFYSRRIARTAERARRHLLTLFVIAWLPLAVLATVTGVAWTGVKEPFLQDLDAQARFLISLPLFIFGEFLLDQRIKVIVGQFTIRDLIAPADQRRYERAMAGVRWLKQSMAAELLILALAFGLGSWLWREHSTLRVSTWFGTPVNGGIRLTLPGFWYAYVSLPIFRLLLLRWYFRLVLWYWFLWRTSRIRLRLNALHPDRAGGLGFLSESGLAFGPMLLAHSFLASADIGNCIWHEGMELPDFKVEIALIVAFLLLLVLLPQTFFVLQINRARRAGLYEYGARASHYVRDFWRKWRQPGQPQSESFLGSTDIQSLADLGNSFQLVRQMGVLPFGKKALLELTVMIALPFAPLILTIASFEEVIEHAIRLIAQHEH